MDRLATHGAFAFCAVVLSVAQVEADTINTFELDHTTFNATQRVDANGHLIVEPAQPSGGVSIALPALTGFWQHFGLSRGNADATLTGAFEEMVSTGTVDRVGNQIVSVTRLEDIGQEVQITTNFPVIQPRSFTAEYFLEGVLVATETDITPASAAWSSLRWPDSWDISFIDISVDWRFSSVAVTTPLGNTVSADFMRVVPFGGLPFNEYSGVTLESDADFTIINETFSIIPEPTTLSLLVLGGLMLTRRRHPHSDFRGLRCIGLFGRVPPVTSENRSELGVDASCAVQLDVGKARRQP